MTTTEHASKRRDLLSRLDQAIALGHELNDLWDKNSKVMEAAAKERQVA